MDGNPRTATSTFTQLLSSVMSNSSSVLLYVHRDHKDYYGRGAQDGHLDFHTAPELSLASNCADVAHCSIHSTPAFRRLPTWRKDVVNESLEFDRSVQALDDTSQFGLAVRRY